MDVFINILDKHCCNDKGTKDPEINRAGEIVNILLEEIRLGPGVSMSDCELLFYHWYIEASDMEISSW